MNVDGSVWCFPFTSMCFGGCLSVTWATTWYCEQAAGMLTAVGHDHNVLTFASMHRAWVSSSATTGGRWPAWRLQRAKLGTLSGATQVGGG